MTIQRSTVERDPERGVVLPIVALAIVALLVMVAIVIDLGSTRSIRRDARSAADSGSTSGALALQDPATTLAACEDAIAFTFRNLSGDPPSASAITTACKSAAPTTFDAPCGSGSAARTATLTHGDRTVSVTNPVPNNSPLMSAVAVGGGAVQSGNTDTDGTSCQRMGVEVTRPQSEYFGGVVGGSRGNFTIHSVARFSPTLKEGPVPPALIALDRERCDGIDAGNNGKIVIRATGTGKGIAYSDSDGASCASGSILTSFNSGRLIAERSGEQSGELGWYLADSSKGYRGSSTGSALGDESTAQNYVGSRTARGTRTTRVPVDSVFHCRNVPVTPSTPLCDAPDDPVQMWKELATPDSAPPGFATYTGCEAPAAVAPSTTRVLGTPGQKLFVNCDGIFEVKAGRVDVAAGATVIFRGKLQVSAGGTLVANVGVLPAPVGKFSNCRTVAPAMPTAATDVDTTLIIRSTASDALQYQSSAARSVLARTTIFSRGGADLQGGPAVQWTPSEGGHARGLLYWSESDQTFALGGGPALAGRGVLFHGRGDVTASGSGVVDLTNVQVWTGRTRISTGTPTMCIAPDPDFSVKVASVGTSLVR